MNIFYLSKDPKAAAEMHCDKHVVKMILETAQMLYSAYWITSPSTIPADAYKLAHKNHPCSIWTRESLQNYMWLAELGWWLCKEYQHRYGASKVHKTEAHIVWLRSNPPPLPSLGITKIRLAMPDEYKREDAVESYREFYKESKMKQRDIVKYSKREWPAFLTSA